MSESVCGKFWGREGAFSDTNGIYLDAVAGLAADLLKHHPNVAGIQDGEDSQGRAKIRLQAPEELVTRVFQIAERFVEAAEMRGCLRVARPFEEIAAESGRLLGVRDEASREVTSEAFRRVARERATGEGA